MPNENIMGVPTRACINGFTKEDTERLKNALIKKIVNDDTVIDITDDGKIIVANGDGLYLSFDGNILGLIKDDSGDYIPQTVPYLPEDENENPLVPPSETIMTSDNIAVDPRIVHTTGNEIITGTKTFNNLIVGRFEKTLVSGGTGHTLLYKRTANRTQWIRGFGGRTCIIAVIRDSAINTFVLSDTPRPYTQPIFYLCTDSNGEITVWVKGLYSSTLSWYLESNTLYGSENTSGINLTNVSYTTVQSINVGDVTPYNADATFTSVIGSTDFGVIR